MDDLNFEFSANMWQSPGKGGWFFVEVPKDISEQIKFFGPTARVGFGSVRVKVAVNGVEWKTSVFPDAKSGCYYLPINAKVRKKAKLVDGQQLDVVLNVVI